MDTRFCAANAGDEADAFQHLRQLTHGARFKLCQKIPAAVGVVQGRDPWFAQQAGNDLSRLVA